MHELTVNLALPMEAKHDAGKRAGEQQAVLCRPHVSGYRPHVSRGSGWLRTTRSEARCAWVQGCFPIMLSGIMILFGIYELVLGIMKCRIR